VKKGEREPLDKVDAVIVRGQGVRALHQHELFKLNGSKDEEDVGLLITFIGDESDKLGLAVDW
jgi:hypothetical protein